MQALLFPVGPEWYALPLTVVREVIPAPLVTRVPGTPRWVAGVANLRGEMLPVIDTCARLSAPDDAQPTHLAVIDTSRGPAGLIITGQPEPVDLGEPSGAGEGSAAIARYPVGSRVATLLDAEDIAGVHEARAT